MSLQIEPQVCLCQCFKNVTFKLSSVVDCVDYFSHSARPHSPLS